MKDGKKQLIYWDTSVLLAWIKNESRPNNEMDGVNEIALKLSKNNVIIITSVLTDTEILNSKLDESAKQKLKDLFKRPNCQKVNVDEKISELSSEIRDYYQQQQIANGKKLTSPDAIHLATAIHYEASAFHTFDNGEKDKKSISLLSLNGNIAEKYSLVVCKPPKPKQPLLLNTLPPASNTYALSEQITEMILNEKNKQN